MNPKTDNTLKRNEKLFVAKNIVKNFIFPNSYKRSRSIKSIDTYFKRMNISNCLNDLSRNSSNFNISLPSAVYPQPIIHTYAIPNKKIKKIKSKSKEDFHQFNSSMKLLMERFSTSKNQEHVIKLERKGMQG